MDVTVALALMAKAKLVFERDDTFLSFPLSPIAYTKNDLNFMSEGTTTPESLLNLSEYSRLVNLIPSGVIWPPTEERYFWDIYQDVLYNSKLASTTRTAIEDAEYQQAFQFLYKVGGDGLREDTDAVKSYNQRKDALYIAQEDYNNKKIEAEFSTDEGLRQLWKKVDEPAFREHLAALEQLWETQGYRKEVDNARHVVAALESQSPITAWEAWKLLFNKAIDTQTDTNNQTFIFSGFSPSNALETNAWQTFTLSEDEANALINQAPTELRERLVGQRLEIESLSFEYSSVAITRPWLVTDIFKARFWQFYESGKLLSDGQLIPKGVCPAFPAALVFARKLEVILKPDSPQNEAVLNSLPATELISLGGIRLTEVASLMGGHQFTTIQSGRLNQILNEIPPSTVTDSVIFPPEIVDEKIINSMSPIEDLDISNNLFSNTIIREATQPDLSVRMNQFLPSAVHQLRIRDFDRISIQNHDASAVTASTSPAAEQTSSSDEIFILAFICKRLPLCPNPDPELQW